LVREICDFLLTGNTPQIIQIAPEKLQQLVLTLVDADLQCKDGSRPLISAQHGQVIYLSMLETLTLEAECPLSYRIYPGFLRYSNQRYLYAAAEDLTALGNTFSKETAELMLYTASVPFKLAEGYKSGCMRFFSMQDNHVSIYFAPYANCDMSLNPALFIRAAESIIVLGECTSPCSSIEDVESELALTESLGAAMMSAKPRLIRVLTCSDDPVDTIFIQAALAELWSDALEVRGIHARDIIVVSRGQSCLPCACRKALEIAREVSDGKDMEAMRVILIS